MHLAYLDDSGTRDKKGKFQVMAGVIIEGWEFRDIELLMGVLVEQLIPEDRREKFEEFHAWQLFGGYEIFDGIEREERLKVVQELLSSVEDHKVTLVYGAVDTEKLANKIYSSADPLDMCFRLCVQGIESWAAQLIRMPVSTKSQAPQDAQPLVVLICDDFESRKKEIIKKSFRQLRNKVRPPNYDAGTTWHLHDDLYFGSSKDSIGIQLADLCAYIIRRLLEGDAVAAGFYDIIKGCIVSSQIEPSEVAEAKEQVAEGGPHG